MRCSRGWDALRQSSFIAFSQTENLHIQMLSEALAALVAQKPRVHLDEVIIGLRLLQCT